MRWKARQYQRKRTVERPAIDWKMALLETVLAAKGEAFSGMMSALYLNDVLAAVLLSMRSYGVAHAWFAAYRPKFAPLSPGLILWLELARIYPQLGIRRLDLGKGPEQYKTHLMSGAIDVAEGSVDLRPMMGMVRRNWCRRATASVARRWARPCSGPPAFSATWSSRGTSTDDRAHARQCDSPDAQHSRAPADRHILPGVPRRTLLPSPFGRGVGGEGWRFRQMKRRALAPSQPCHCLEQAVPSLIRWARTACSKQWHTAARNAV